MVPPLLNDFIGLQKDTALVALIPARGSLSSVADRGRVEVRLHDALLRHGAHVRRLDDPMARFTDWLTAGSGGGCGERVELHGSASRFGTVEVLHGIDLEVGEHEVVC